MKREFLKTGDGSITIHLPEWNEQYHSKHGAIAEARHVFLKMGFSHLLEGFSSSDISILEIGFGTGLNAFLTLLEAEQLKHKVIYTGVEAYPVDLSEVKQLNYPENLRVSRDLFLQIHEVSWESEVEISKYFSLAKQKLFFHELSVQDQYHLIFFDAFGPRVQPELWTEDIFLKMFEALKPNGILVTYSAKGSVRRAMQAVGFTVERLPGPPGKREMLRARKQG